MTREEVESESAAFSLSPLRTRTLDGAENSGGEHRPHFKNTPSWRAMWPRWAPLLLLGATLGALVPGGCSGSLTHSLWYLPESEHNQGLPQSFIRGYLDDQPIARYDSLTGKMEPLVPWMEEGEKARFHALEWVFGADLEKLSDLNHQTGGLHNWQVNWGCELWEDGSQGGFLHYGYDGRDFISFDKETLRWVAAQPQAEKVKEKWEDHPGWTQRKKTYLEKTCIEWLQRYLSYRKEAPQRIEPPVGKVTHKMVDDSLEILICQAFGFYPKEIQATWTRDGEICQYETLHRNVAPNSDGTYYVWLTIEIDPKERDRYRCRLEHEGLQEPLIFAFEEETAALWWIPVGIAVVIFLILGIVFLKWQRQRCRKKFHQQESTCSDPDSVEKLPSLPLNVRSSHSTTQPMEGGGPRELLKALSQCCTKQQVCKGDKPETEIEKQNWKGPWKSSNPTRCSSRRIYCKPF